jgi:hypothetical protein
MPFRIDNLGSVLAIVVGVFTLTLAHWAVPAPQALLGDLGALWTLGLLVAGACFLAAPFVADRHTGAARALLVGPA